MLPPSEIPLKALLAPYCGCDATVWHPYIPIAPSQRKAFLKASEQTQLPERPDGPRCWKDF